MSTVTDNKDELDKILRSLKYQVLNKQVNEKDWQAKVWFEVTDKARVELLALIEQRETELVRKLYARNNNSEVEYCHDFHPPLPCQNCVVRMKQPKDNKENV